MKTTSHIRRSGEQWRRLIQEQADSGQSQAAFCKMRRLSLSTFQYWKKHLSSAREETSTPTTPWLELPAMLSPASGVWDIELDLGDGVRLRLSRR